MNTETNKGLNLGIDYTFKVIDCNVLIKQKLISVVVEFNEDELFHISFEYKLSKGQKTVSIAEGNELIKNESWYK